MDASEVFTKILTALGRALEDRTTSIPPTPHFDPEKTGRTGLQLVTMLCKSEFGTTPKFYNSAQGNARVEISFPIMQENG